MLTYLIKHSGDKEPGSLKFRTAIGYDEKTRKMPWPLPNMKPITEGQFWHNMINYTHKAETYLPPPWEDGGPHHEKYHSVKVFFVDHGANTGGGFAVAWRQGQWDPATKATKDIVRYFSWCACDHVFTARTVGNCLTEYKCTKCPAQYQIDSSG